MVPDNEWFIGLMPLLFGGLGSLYVGCHRIVIATEFFLPLRRSVAIAGHSYVRTATRFRQSVADPLCQARN
jgi:hypothetical protein